MDLENATAAAIVRQIDGTTYSFPRLHMGHLGELLAELREQKRQALMKTLELAKSSQREKLDALRDLDDKHLDTFDGMRWSKTPDGNNRVLLQSLKLANSSATMADVHTLPLDPVERLAVGFELWGFRLQPSAAKGEKEEDGSPLSRTTGSPSTGP
jgi:DnaJ-domain-containing protein 1